MKISFKLKIIIFMQVIFLSAVMLLSAAPHRGSAHIYAPFENTCLAPKISLSLDMLEDVFNKQGLAEIPDDSSGLISNMQQMREIVRLSSGVRHVLAVSEARAVNSVSEQLADLSTDIFRADSGTDVFAYSADLIKGQLLTMLSAYKDWRRLNVDVTEDVTLGVLALGQSMRMSPLVQREFGLKALLKLLIRTDENSPWLSAMSASLYSWNLAAYHLQRMGFKGIAWAWSDEVKIASKSLDDMDYDLENADIVFFSSKVKVTPKLAENKEWLYVDEKTDTLIRQVNRNSYEKLVEQMGGNPEELGFKAHINVGNPAFSYMFMDALGEIFGDISGVAINVDGAFIKAITLDKGQWEKERESDQDINRLEKKIPGFYERVQLLKKRIAEKKGQPFAIKVIDLGEGLYWPDAGLADSYRDSFIMTLNNNERGEFFRQMAGVAGIKRDRFGNIVVGECVIPQDGSVRDSLLINAKIFGNNKINGAVLMDTECMNAAIEEGSVLIESTILNLSMGRKALSFNSIGENIDIRERQLHTNIPRDFNLIAAGIDNWRSNMGNDLSKEDFFKTVQFGNPGSFAELSRNINGLKLSFGEIERQIDKSFRDPLSIKMRMLNARQSIFDETVKDFRKTDELVDMAI